jgi:hypothetical protein
MKIIPVMENLPLYIFIASVLHVTEEYYFPGGFLSWAKKILPKYEKRLNAKFAVIVNGLFIMLCAAGVLTGMKYPGFILSISGLILVNGILHILSSVFTKSYSPGLITSLILYIPTAIYSFVIFNLSAGETLLFIIYGFLYHAAVPLFLFAPFNKPKTLG